MEFDVNSLAKGDNRLKSPKCPKSRGQKPIGKDGMDLSEGSINQSKTLHKSPDPPIPVPLNWQSFLIWKMKTQEANIFISAVFFNRGLWPDYERLTI